MRDAAAASALARRLVARSGLGDASRPGGPPARGRCAARYRRPYSAPGRIRTCGLALRRRTLYPLSYRRSKPSSLLAVDLAYRTVTLPLAAPFRISRSTDVEVELVWVELTAAGVTGYGEATPQDNYGESVDLGNRVPRKKPRAAR